MNIEQQKRAQITTARVADFLRANPGAGRYSISSSLGITGAQAQRALYEIKTRGAPPPLATQVDGKITETRKDDTRDLDSGLTTSICTLEQLLEKAQVDRTKWDVERHLVNKYSVATKDESTGKVTISDLFQVKATLVPVKGSAEVDAMRQLIADLKAEAARGVPKSVAVRAPRVESDDEVLLEISPFDLHHGKLSWAKETGVAYDSKISEACFTQAIENLWNLAQAFPVKRVLLVLGQDFFTVDSDADTTTAGTPQDVDSRFAKNFRTGWQMMRNSIEFLRARCPGGVDVIIIPGNHDVNTAFCAGEVLSALYEHTEDVRVDNDPAKRKYFRYGTNLLGFSHGHSEKHAQLPLIMANERSQDWAETTTREIHLGHFHHSRSTTFNSGSEHNSIRVRVLPSLSGADAWHTEHGYLSKRAAEAYLWSFKRGYVGHLSYTP